MSRWHDTHWDRDLYAKQDAPQRSGDGVFRQLDATDPVVRRQFEQECPTCFAWGGHHRACPERRRVARG